MDAKYLKTPPEIVVHDETVIIQLPDRQVLVMGVGVAEAFAHLLSKAALSAEMGRSEVIHRAA
jgi:hypothetical protein